MRYSSFLFLMAALTSSAALAEPQEQRILLDSSVCREIADYAPGVDINGRAVAPADLSDDADMGAGLEDGVVITLKLDLAKRLGIPPVADLPSEAQIGTLTRGEQGGLFLNGKPLGRPGPADLAALCR